ncbi:hypothetical protein AHAS_Ahas05G0049400 [Arachis hypogaea]
MNLFRDVLEIFQRGRTTEAEAKFEKLLRRINVKSETVDLSKRFPLRFRYLASMPGSLEFDWVGLGASNISQAGGLACFSPDGLKAMQDIIGFYKENTNIIFNHAGYAESESEEE